jgi:N6-L-threonylcarbamoyladenine synthase
MLQQLRTRSPPLASYSLARLFTVLAFESSADDTCAAVVTHKREVLSNVVIKQHILCACYYLTQYLGMYLQFRHEKFGGIHPTVAIEAHQRNMVLYFIFRSEGSFLNANYSDMTSQSLSAQL